MTIKKRIFYISHWNFWFTIAITKIKLELDWLIELIVEPKNVLYIIYIRLFVKSNLSLIGPKASPHDLKIVLLWMVQSMFSFPLTINQKRIRSNQNWIKIIVNAWQDWSTYITTLSSQPWTGRFHPDLQTVIAFCIYFKNDNW